MWEEGGEEGEWKGRGKERRGVGREGGGWRGRRMEGEREGEEKRSRERGGG